MNKYVVTVLMDGEEYPITVSAKDGLQANKKVKQSIDNDCVTIHRVETRKEYKERIKPFNQVMTSSFQSVRTTKRAVYGD